MACYRVVVTLRGLLASPSDDRFLQAALFAGRIKRDKGEWQARPAETERLSDIVLSLFVVDILSHRDFHEKNLCVCDVCGRLSFDRAQFSRFGCIDHSPKSEATSGFQPKSGTTSGEEPSE